ncbi:putative signal-transduction protein containing cAMP-binding and CBS domains [Thermus thermophilus]|nr:putative signal-transduction protein containing cAMP-binding and CBS domains [Thermus thermophilus]BDB11321.1 hypothetical protein TthTMY_10600 [Thermus thermophilus]
MREDIKVKDLMTSPAVGVPLGTTLDQVAALMLEKRIGSVLVVDEKGKLVGIVTESDFLNGLGAPPRHLPGHAPQEEAVQPRAPVGAQDHEVVLFRLLQDDLRRQALQEVGLKG